MIAGRVNHIRRRANLRQRPPRAPGVVEKVYFSLCRCMQLNAENKHKPLPDALAAAAPGFAWELRGADEMAEAELAAAAPGFAWEPGGGDEEAVVVRAAVVRAAVCAGVLLSSPCRFPRLPPVSPPAPSAPPVPTDGRRRRLRRESPRGRPRRAGGARRHRGGSGSRAAATTPGARGGL